MRIDGRVCLVTGANSGLGKAVAIDLAKRGGHVLMACRGGHPEAGEDVRRSSGSGAVEMLRVDLADLDSVHALSDELGRAHGRVDIAVLNAGVMPRKARKSPQGHELMFTVHFLANRLLIHRLLTDSTIRTEKAAAPVTHACCAEEMGLRSGVYLHLMQEKEASPLAMHEAAGARLWEESDALLAKHAPRGAADAGCAEASSCSGT